MTVTMPHSFVIVVAYAAIAIALFVTFQLFTWIGARTVDAAGERVRLVVAAVFGWVVIEVSLALARQVCG